MSDSCFFYFSELPPHLDHKIVDGKCPVWETARYRSVTGVIIKGERKFNSNGLVFDEEETHSVMWFHERDNFTKKYKTRKDAMICGKGLYE